MATLWALSPSAAIRNLHVDTAAGRAFLQVGVEFALTDFQDLVLSTAADGSGSYRIKAGRIVTIRPGWVYMWEFHRRVAAFVAEFLRADEAVASAGSATLICRTLGRPHERLGFGGVFLKALTYQL